MKIIIRNYIYLMMITGIVTHQCCAMDDGFPKNEYQVGGLYPGVNWGVEISPPPHLPTPTAPSLQQNFPILSSASMPQSVTGNSSGKNTGKKTLSECSSQDQLFDYYKQQQMEKQKQGVFSKKQEQPVQPDVQNNAESNNVTNKKTFGWGKDVSGQYDNTRGILYKFFETTSHSFMRITDKTNLILISVGNTYKELYREDNHESSVFRIELFNTYEKGKQINGVNTSHYGICIGNREGVLKPNDMGVCLDSSNWVVSVSRKNLAALIIAGYVFKYGAMKAMLRAVGIGVSGFFIIPVMIVGAVFFPLFIAIGGSIIALGLGVSALAAGATVTALAPMAVPLLLVAALIRS